MHDSEKQTKIGPVMLSGYEHTRTNVTGVFLSLS